MKSIDELQFFADTIRAAQEDDGAPVPLPTPSARRMRNLRPREGRAKTISIRQMGKHETEIGRLLYPETDYWKPRIRGECVDGPRPCPYVSCAYHLYLDTGARTGALKLNFPDLEVWELGDSCALDIAAYGGAKLEEVGMAMNLTRERVRQIEVKALAKLERLRAMRALADEDGTIGRRHLPVLIEDDEDEAPKEEDEDDVDDTDEG
jgi:hypothetical protein